MAASRLQLMSTCSLVAPSGVHAWYGAQAGIGTNGDQPRER
jgi:hypothetical protein